jgi:hypothetical protein
MGGYSHHVWLEFVFGSPYSYHRKYRCLFPIRRRLNFLQSSQDCVNGLQRPNVFLAL